MNVALLLSVALLTQVPAPVPDVQVEPRLGQRLPLGVRVVDESGTQGHLSRYFGERPVILALVYYECPMLCTMVLNGVAQALRTIELTAGQDYELIAISIDPRERPELAAEKKRAYVARYAREGSDKGWHFLTAGEEDIGRIAGAVGFQYEYQPSLDQYAHAAAISVITPGGQVSRYLYGVEYSPRDLRLALVEAARGTIGTTVDRLLLLCFHYNPASGKYGFAIVGALRILGAATALALTALIAVLIIRDRNVPPHPVGASGG